MRAKLRLNEKKTADSRLIKSLSEVDRSKNGRAFPMSVKRFFCGIFFASAVLKDGRVLVSIRNG
jgi:hypothetical protein